MSKHRFSSAKSDGADSTQVQPSNWNDLHDTKVTALSGNTTLDSTHDMVLVTTGASTITITLPAVSGLTGRTYTIMKVDSGTGTVVVDGNASETINGDLTYTLTKQYETVELVCDGTNWLIRDVRTGFSVASVTTITATGSSTYTVPAGVKAIMVECIGGGGGGGGVSGAASQTGAAGGGGAGGYAKLFIVAPAASYSVSVGAAANGGTAGNNAGTAGNNTTFGSGPIITCNGGSAGAGMATGTSVVQSLGGAGGTATGGDVNIPGGAGGNGIRFSGTQASSGYGGDSMLGFGGNQTFNTAGNNATNYGGGGGGACTSGNTNRAGGNGSQGVIIVTEYK